MSASVRADVERNSRARARRGPLGLAHRVRRRAPSRPDRPKLLDGAEPSPITTSRGAGRHRSRRRLGRPPRDPGDARDNALAWDIEGFRPSPDRSWDDQLRNRHGAVGGIRGEHALTFVTHPDKYDDRTGRYWRDAGRRSWAALGAWPWALTDNGKLTKTWWKRPAYPDALRYWAATR